MIHLVPVARSIAIVLAVGNILIVVHELGHFLAARLAGVHARRFAIGIGPTLARITDRHGTEWSLALLPVGGFVSFHGERSVRLERCDRGERSGRCERNADDKRSYAARSPLVRIGIIAAGPVGNILLAIAVFAIMLSTSGEPAFLPIADQITPGSAAEHAGFQPGDRIVTMNGLPIARFEDLRPSLGAGAGKTFHFQVNRHGRGDSHGLGDRRGLVDRHGQVVDLFASLTPARQDGQMIGVLGIRSLTQTHLVMAPGAAIVGAAEKTRDVLADTVSGVARAVTRGQDTQNFAGVVGIATLTGQAVDQGIPTLLALVAILSANLALMNLLPIPILDGGALLFCLAELALRRPVPARIQDLATGAGFATLATMFMLSTLHDLSGIGVFRWLAQL